MSPLRHYTIMQTKKLGSKIRNENIIVDYAMRYGNPSIKNKIEIKEKLGKINPQYIARNHLVDQAINHALDGDYSKFHNLHKVLKAPFNFSKQN